MDKKTYFLFAFVESIIILNLLLCSYVEVQANNDAYLVQENFEDIDLGVNAKELGWLFTDGSNMGCSATVEIENGNKALKLAVKNNTNNATKPTNTQLRKVFENMPLSGCLEISYRIKSENHSKSFSDFGTILKDGGGRILALYSSINTINQRAGKNGIGSIGDTYKTFRYSFNIDSNLYSVYCDDELKIENVPYEGGVLGIQFACDAGSFSTPGASTGDGIYWIDDLTVKQLKLEIVETLPQTNTEDVSIESNAEFTFNEKISVLDDSKFKVYEDGIEINNCAVTTEDNKLCLTPNNGLQYNKEYTIVLLAGIVESAIGKNEEYSISFVTETIIGEISNLKNYGKYGDNFTPNIVIPDGINYNMVLKHFEKDEVYEAGTKIVGLGQYTLVITATNTSNNKQEVRTYIFELLSDAAPIAENVIITGEAHTGSELEGTYLYVDYNGDAEGESKYQWLKSDKVDGQYEKITGAIEKTYRLTTSDENHFICFEVTPIAINAPYEGEAVRSEPFIGAFLPVATEVTININDGVLTGRYTFTDINDDEEGASNYKWFYCDKDGENRLQIQERFEQEYALSESDIDNHIMFEVTPVSNKAPYHGYAAKSLPFALPASPEARGVEIIGNPIIGQTLGVKYTFYDADNDHENSSTYKWFVDGMLYSKGAFLALDSSLKGKTLYVTVTPRSDHFPYQGKEETSVSVVVRDKIISSGSISSSVGGITSPQGNTQVATPNAMPLLAEQKKPVEEKGEAFSDIEGHWAKDEISIMAEKKIINGINGEFKPENYITRAETAAIIVRAFDYDPSAHVKINDVADNEWYANYVYAVIGNEIMVGDGSNFRPNDYISREEICVVFTNIASKMNLPLDETEYTYSDSKQISEWARVNVYEASNSGLVKGVGDGMFLPKENVTRAQLVVIMQRLFKALEAMQN